MTIHDSAFIYIASLSHLQITIIYQNHIFVFKFRIYISGLATARYVCVCDTCDSGCVSMHHHHSHPNPRATGGNGVKACVLRRCALAASILLSAICWKFVQSAFGFTHNHYHNHTNFQKTLRLYRYRKIFRCWCCVKNGWIDGWIDENGINRWMTGWMDCLVRQWQHSGLGISRRRKKKKKKKLFMKAEYGRIDEHCTRVFRAR